MTADVGLLGVVFLVLFWAVGAYNRLVSLRNQFNNAFSQIDVQLRRRYDLISNLVETAKGTMKHESQTLEAVILARNQAVAANAQAAADPASMSAMQHMASTESTLGTSLGKLFALCESYSDLKASQNMMQLTEELTSTENRIAFSRQAFNDAAMLYNTALEQFPGSVIATIAAFKRAELLQATESPQERKAIKSTF